MDQEIKRKWLEALRSGKYQQTRGRLRALDGYSFCCLGVLCDVMGVEWGKAYTQRWDKESTKILIYSLSLPQEIIEESGINPAGADQCAMKNDGDPKQNIPPLSFPEIADYIEANL